MTIIHSQEEFDQMMEKAEADIANGRTYSLKEVYEKLYTKKKELEYV